jgi:ferritin
MLSKRVEEVLNGQVQIEANSSQFYLAMASWAENNGYEGTSQFLFSHSDEERSHMLKLVRFINEAAMQSFLLCLSLKKRLDR